MAWHRVRAADKLAWFEDLASDPTLTDLQKRMAAVIAKNWQAEAMTSECSLTFIANGAGCKKKLAHRYAKALVDSGRVSIVRSATYTASTLWAVNWWFRGSAWVRQMNGGPIIDCRKQSPNDAHEESPSIASGESPADAQGESPSVAGGSPPSGGPIPSLTGGYMSLPDGSARLEGEHGSAEEEEKRNPHKPPPGFAIWRITKAEYEDDETFVAHLRSGNKQRFVLRRDVDSEEYGELNEALCIDGDADSLKGKLLAMSTNRTGAKRFMRGAPDPWRTVTIQAGDSNSDGSADVTLSEDGDEFRITLRPDDAARLIDACGGEAEAIGAQVNFRLMPDDSFEFRRLR